MYMSRRSDTIHDSRKPLLRHCRIYNLQYNKPRILLVGNWQWIRTDGGIANHIHDTPASTGQEKTLQLNANNTYTIRINNAISSQGSFTVRSQQCIHDGETKPYIEFDHDPGMMVEVVDSTFLKLSDEANDGTDSQYQRVGATEPG